MVYCHVAPDFALDLNPDLWATMLFSHVHYYIHNYKQQVYSKSIQLYHKIVMYHEQTTPYPRDYYQQ